MPEAGNLLAVGEVTERAAFGSLEREWDALAKSGPDEAFHRHAFVRIWVDNFAADAKLRVLTARGPDGRLDAVLPLVASRTTFHGVPVRQLAGAANAHSCRFDLLARDPQAAGRAFVEHLRAGRDWDLLVLTDVPEGGNGFELANEAARSGLPIGAWESLVSPYARLDGGVEALRERWHAKLKANCRRRRKKLAASGEVSFEWYSGGRDLDARLEEGFAIEQSGWKGRRGTAVAQDLATRGFYAELAREHATRGELALCFLRAGGKAVAFHFALCREGKYLLLKPGYDEAFHEFSPGQLLMEEVLCACASRGLSELDFLGPDMPWKRDWADGARRHSWLYVFRDSLFGRALHAAKFRWGRAAKEVWAKWTDRSK